MRGSGGTRGRRVWGLGEAKMRRWDQRPGLRKVKREWDTTRFVDC
jgi:hypothetical protein